MEKDTSEIAKLTERIAKDPKSKLFVPLAEEYKKAGDITMAIQVLNDGLKNNPSYVTARSFLGRLLLEQGDLAAAQKELEEVIKSIPDNLLAQRKLGDLYVLQGRAQDAMQRYKAALALNPSDKELPSLIADIGAGKDISARIPKPKAQPPAPAAPAAAPAAAKAPAPAAALEATVVKAAPAAGPKPQPAAAPAVPVVDEAEVVEEIVHIESIEQPDTAPKKAEIAPAAPPQPAAFDLSEAAAPAAAEAMEAPVWGGEETMTAAASVAAAQAPAAEEGGDDLNTNTLAELYISQGFYDKAIEVYQGMLGDRPGNKALLQKLEQLKALAGEQSSAPLAVAVPAAGRAYTPPAEPAAAAPATAGPAPAPAPPRAEAPAAAQVAPAPAAAEPAAPPVRGAKTASMRRKQTIDRLESWLKNVQKEKA